MISIAKQLRKSLSAVAGEIGNHNDRIGHQGLVDICARTTPSTIGILQSSIYFNVI